MATVVYFENEVARGWLIRSALARLPYTEVFQEFQVVVDPVTKQERLAEKQVIRQGQDGLNSTAALLNHATSLGLAMTSGHQKDYAWAQGAMVLIKSYQSWWITEQGRAFLDGNAPLPAMPEAS